MVRRIFIEKKQGFDVEATALFKELCDNLNITAIRSLKVLHRYDVENISDELFAAAGNIFAEPNLDNVYLETPMLSESAFYFGVEYLPGQYDQRADSAAQCIRLLSSGSEPVVRYAKMICIDGEISADDKIAIKDYCINPVDSRESDMDKPDSLTIKFAYPPDVPVLRGFCELEDTGLEDLRKELALAMSFDDISFIQNHFTNDEKRDPSMTEIKVLDTYWSDHCRHTTFHTELTEIEFENGDLTGPIRESYDEYLKHRQTLYGDTSSRPVCLMDMATIGMKLLKKSGQLSDLDESDEVNACSIKIKARVWDEAGENAERDGDDAARGEYHKEPREEDWLLMFKNETHNHPTEIEPFGGASTCLGGAIRDPLSGRSYVYQAMRITGSGDPRTPLPDTLPGKLPQYLITRGAAKGYSSYGNQIGLATGFVDELYHEGYVAKRMELGAVIGAAAAENVRREKPEEGDIILLVGGRTGRDGIGGATGSSKGHTTESVRTAGAEVQKGNPPEERAIQRLFRDRNIARMIKKCNDFGAGGVSVAIGELADSIDVELDKVPKKYDGLDGTELAISESQERMAVVIAPADLDEFISQANSENIEATHVATVTDSGRFRMTWRGKFIFDLPRVFIDTNGVRARQCVFIENRDYAKAANDALSDNKEPLTEEGLLALISSLPVCSKRGLIENFDSTIGRRTILMPLGGKNQITPTMGMAAKLPVMYGETDTVSLMTYGFDPALSAASPWHGAIYAVIDSLAKLTALGGDAESARLSFQEFFPTPGDEPKRMALPLMALLGAVKAQTALGIPAIGGKDSMSGSFNELDVPPTLVSFAVGLGSADRVLSPEFKKSGSALVLVKCPKDNDLVPGFDAFKKNMSLISELNKNGRILSAGNIGRGGIFSAAAVMALGNGIGAELKNISNRDLTSPDYGSLILEIAPDDEIFKELGLDKDICVDENTPINIRMIGKTIKDEEIRVFPDNGDQTIMMGLSTVRECYEKPLAAVFPVSGPIGSSSTGQTKNETPEALSFVSSAGAGVGEHAPGRTPAQNASFAKPRVCIPAFPGTNCEDDSSAAFRLAGAEPRVVNFVNMNAKCMDDSISLLRDTILNSQILMIPGGFSAGDEPEGSAKYIVAVFRNPYIKEAVTELLERRDGLILGICNGFQALIKLGLVPYGKIMRADELAEAPTLTYNSIGRHQSRLVRTRVSSTLSPWLACRNIGEVFTAPVSHGEGRFIATDESLAALISNGQIATQYSDERGEPSMDIEVNPNGSLYAVEGITSPDGRVFGKMTHVERTGDWLYKNVPGDYDSKIFRSGVLYYR